MSHITNDDFSLVHSSDCNMLSWKSYGVLPLKDISITLYSVGLAIIPALEANAGNDVVDIPALAHVPPLDEAFVHNVIEDESMEDIGNHQEIIGISDSQVDFDRIGSYTIARSHVSFSACIRSFC